MAISSDGPFAIRRLTADDVAGGEALVAEAGWNQVAADWRIFLECGNAYAISDGRSLIATAAILPYARFAWISMVLVTGSCRRRGLASQLMRRCIDDLLARGLVPVLDATPAGRAVYGALGFLDSWSYQRLAGTGGAGPSSQSIGAPTTIRAVGDDVWPAICAYDGAAFGADRARVLAHLRSRLPHAALMAERGGRIRGIVLGRNGRTASQIGPLVCDDDQAAIALLDAALAAISGPVYIDLADGKPETFQWLAARGFVPQRPLTRMMFGRSERFDDSERTFAVAGPELG